MTVPGNLSSPLLATATAAAAADAAYVIPKSLRFDSSSTSHLSRTPSSAGNRKTFTWSGWVKRAKLGAAQSIFTAGTNASTAYDTIEFASSDQIHIYSYNYPSFVYDLRTTQVFRDVSAWYHIVFSVNTGDSTANDRVKLYVNGVRVEDFGTNTTPTQNVDSAYWNTANPHYIGYSISRYPADKYLADIQFVDGQALAPTDFGETRSSDGVWVPKEYTGPYGPNKVSKATGALPILNTTGDFGGTAASGTRADANSSNIVLALPFNGSDDGTTITDQHATIKGSGSAKTISRAGVVTKTAESQFYGSSAFFDGTNDTIEITSGLSDLAFGTGDFTVEGWAYRTGNTEYAPMLEVGNHINSTGIFFMFADSNASNAARFYSGGFYGNTGTLPLNEWYHLAFVRNGDTVKIYVNGVERSSVAFTNNLTDSSSAYISDTVGYSYRFQGYMNDLRVYKGVAKYTSNFVPPLRSGNGFHLNFSDSSTNEALGFDSAPTIPALDPKKGFDVVTYTGNGASTPGGSGSTQNVGGLGFEPGLLWIKDRTQSGHNHNLIDVINQPPNLLMSDSTAALTTNSTDGVTSFNPDGFALGANSSGSQSLEMNKSGNNYVAWAWKAGGRAVSNTNGSITSQVSASPDYGFSVVKWTGTAATATVGHGLSSAPKWILVKFTGSTSQWSVYHESVGNTKRLLLNSSDVAATGSTYWNDTSPTSTLFTVGGDLNDSTEITAYCWSEVSGFSKFGSWTGTGSAGLTVTTGFKPRFLMWKRTDNAQNWAMVDSERSGSNPMDDWLGPAYSDNESSNNSAYSVDFLDDGFSINATHAATNASGGTYIYMCFADRPGNNWDVNNIVTNEGLTTSKTQFDVVRWTGNGGDLKIGGPVYSDGWTGSINSTHGAAASFDGNDSTYTRSEISATCTWTAPSSIAFTTLKLRGAVDSGNGTIEVNGVDVTSQFTANSSTLNTQTITGVTSPLTSIKLIGNASSQPRIAFVEVDGTKLLDGTGPGLKFQPDFVWIKDLTNTYSHRLADSVRGSTRVLFSDQTNAEQVNEYGTIDSFNSDGFTLRQGSNNSGVGSNTNNANMVAWCWKAGGTAVSNTNGSVTSSVSANAAYGFSIVTFTTGTAAFSLGHGLSTTPKLVIHKDRDNAYIWTVYHADLGPNKYLTLNANGGATTSSGQFGTGPTDSVVNFSSGYANNNDGVCYCFADVPGYQRIGSYTGNGSGDGPVVVTGFKPRFVMVKRTDGDGSWVMLDSERNPVNPRVKSVYAEVSDAEYQPGQSWMDFDESSFQPRATYGDVNANGGTYIYLAIGDDELGSDEDCLVDVPNAVTADADETDTTGGYQRGNYATLNPLAISPNSTPTLSNGNLEIERTATASEWTNCGSTVAVSTGQWYWEIQFTTINGTIARWGVADADDYEFNRSTSGTGLPWLGSSTGTSWSMDVGGNTLHNGSTVNSSYTSTVVVGDVIGVALDCDANTLTFYKNGVSLGTAHSNVTASRLVPAVSLHGGTHNKLAFNFGQMRFKYPMPSGYAALNTTALPAATIADGLAQFDVATYSGNGGTQTISGLNFAGDLFWFKSRSATHDNWLFDSVRGLTEAMYSNGTSPGYDYSPNGVSATSDTGFTLTSSGQQFNANSTTYVGWVWNASANSNKTYTVKVVSDSGNKYRFDDFGTSAVTLDLAEGSTYVFDQSDSSNSGHPLRFSTTSDGTHGGGSEYTTGVTATGTPGSAGAKTTIVVGSGVATLYYYCSSHSGMGGQANTNSTAGSSNFDGSIQSTVKANPEAGFSIVTGTGSSSAAKTCGHGLNAEPHFIIVKLRVTAGNGYNQDWQVYHKDLGNTKGLKLNTTAATETSSSIWNNTSPTSSVFSIGASSRYDGNFVAYCFAPVAGYSAMGTFVGNYSADGPFVYTGFRPAFLMWKNTTNSGFNWGIIDSTRGPINYLSRTLNPNATNSESGRSTADAFDFLSNGFKVRASGSNARNQNGSTFIWMAFAENPFSANGGLAR